jgi:hypothetical protein
VLQWYGRRLALQIANRDADVLIATWASTPRIVASQDMFFKTLNPKAIPLQQLSDIALLFQKHEFINSAFQVSCRSLFSNVLFFPLFHMCLSDLDRILA